MDQDYYQLLRDPGPGGGGVRVFNTAMRPGHRIIGTAQVAARHGVNPRQYVAPPAGSCAPSRA